VLLEQRGKRVGAEAAYVALTSDDAANAFNLGELLEQRGEFGGANEANKRAQQRGDGEFAQMARASETSGALATNHCRSFVPPTTYRRNAARVAAAVELKYSGGRTNPHSRNFTPSVTARRYPKQTR